MIKSRHQGLASYHRNEFHTSLSGIKVIGLCMSMIAQRTGICYRCGTNLHGTVRRVFWLRIELRTFCYLTIKHRVPWLALQERSRNTGDNSKPKTISLCIQDDVNDKFSIFRSLRRLAKNKAIGNSRADKRLNLQRTLNKLEYT